MVKKQKLNMVNLEDLIGFIYQFINWEASHPVNRREPPRATEKERFLKERGDGTRKS